MRINPATSVQQLRRLLRHCISSPPPRPPPPHLSPFSAASSRSLPRQPFFPLSFISLSRPFSSQTLADDDAVAGSISAELLKDPESDPLPLSQRLDRISFTPSSHLLLSTLNISPDAGRTALELFHYVSSIPGYTLDDATVSCFVSYFGRRNDFKAIHEVLSHARGVAGAGSLKSAINCIVRAGRPTHAMSFFDKMEEDYGFVRDQESLRLIVSMLCDHGFGSYAEKMVKDLANQFFPDENMCNLLIKGWCVGGKLEEAWRLAEEMQRGGFDIGVSAYNSILDCVCKLCRKKDPFRIHSEAEKVLQVMDAAGVRRNVGTFNVLITNFCKIRKTEAALKMFDGMDQWGCVPDVTTFHVLIKSLYQAARVGEGDEMIDRMKAAGFGESLTEKAYCEFLTILCGIERIDHAMKVFGMMKKDGCKPGVKTYDLLIRKMVVHGRVRRVKTLRLEAASRGLTVTPKAYAVDPRFARKKPMAKKTEKKRETLPEKMARKRKTLRKLRQSYVKKPRKMMRRAY